MTFVPPDYRATAFTCPHCGVLAQQTQDDFFAAERGELPVQRGKVRKCKVCDERTIFFNGQMIFPVRGVAPPPAEDMPAAVRGVYEEAAAVSSSSPRAASALLRTGVEVLVMQDLGGKGRLFDAIGDLVAQGRISKKIARAMDVVRVTGNGAVHPGQIDPDDDQQVATALFSLLNLIVESAITEEARLDAMFNSLPAGARDAIARRDGEAE